MTPEKIPKGPDPVRGALRLRDLKWLTEQVQTWQAEGLIDAGQAGAILNRYETAEQIADRRRHRSFVALCGLAVLMCGAGVLLLISYNWEDMSRVVKVGLIFSVVVAAFAGAVVAYRGERPVLGELLVFAGTILYGCAIWLLAQVFHIESHYPDGVRWWMIGALFTAYAVRSRFNALEAVALMTLWVLMEGCDFGRPNYHFIPYGLLAVGLAYRLRSVVVLVAAILAVANWLLVTSVTAWEEYELFIELMVLAGGAYYAAALFHKVESGFARAWTIVGIAVLLIALMPLSFNELHEGYWGRPDPDRFWTVLPIWVSAAVLFGFTLAGYWYARRFALREDWPVLAACVLALVRLVIPLGPRDRVDPWMPYTMAILFSAATVVLGLWLILRGVRLDRGLSFFAGVIALLVFVLVRWVDLIGDMISSAVLFFLAGVCLFITAYFWRRRSALLKPASGEVLRG